MLERLEERRREQGRTPGKQVAILNESSTSWGANVIWGIADFAREHGPWYFHVEPRGLHETLHLPPGWQGDGIIARVTHPTLLAQIRATHLPAVDVSWHPFSEGHMPRCSSDEAQIGRMTFAHLQQLGLKHFAYCGPWFDAHFVDAMGQSFIQCVEDAGHRCHVNRTSGDPPETRAWLSDLADLGQWLAGLPRPLGVMAYNDLRGRRVLEACRYADLHVPDDVAVICGGADDLMGALAHPPLTTVDADPRQVGYEAARLLNEMMLGRPPAETLRLIPPRCVIQRPSTDRLATSDPWLARALRFIREHAHEGIQVVDVVEAMGISRRLLEQRFMTALQKSPGDEIRRARIERVKRLLIETHLPIARIATACAFRDPESMTRLFKSRVGLSPHAFRQRHR